MNTAGKGATTTAVRAGNHGTGQGMAQGDLSEIHLLGPQGRIQLNLIRLMKADFEAFTRESGKVQGDINHYNIQASDSLTDRAKDVMTNVRDFVMSYNFDESDPMTDYFHTNFYLTLGIGSYRQPYRMELPKITGKDTPEVFRYPEGPAHKAVRQALGKARFGFIESRRHIGEMILGEDFYGSQGEHYFWPKEYSSAKTAQKRIGNWRQPECAAN